ncbi:MAG: fibronectin type III domain-containing protein [Bifidobacteriaceae bacterium]|jgi:hypothetical protein|nr:fibronectin type III domain-containing protein [Bifidobacteriaceae bacterium]
MRRARLSTVFAALSAAILLPLGAGVGPAQAAGVLDPYGLNNGFGQNPKTERVITWLGLDKTKYTSPYVKLDIGGVAVTASTTCTTKDVTKAISDYTAYTCTVKGLTPGTTYNYLVGAKIGSTDYESPKYQFTTEAASTSEFTFLDFADSQGDEDLYTQFWGNTLSKALSQHPEAVFLTHTGDIVDDVDKDHMTGWLNATGKNLRSLAFNPGLGNHDDGSSEGVMWEQLFSRPSLTAAPSTSTSYPLQYVQVYGNALFLYVNTNLDSSSELQKTSAWVKQAVAAYGTNGDGTSRFIIVLEHKSPFGGKHAGSSSYPAGDYNNSNIVKELPKTYAEVGVDLVLAGHDHNLIRSQPITWDLGTGKAAWGTATNASTPLSNINSGLDGLVYYIPRNSGEKTYKLIDPPKSSSRPWINWYYASTDYGNEQPSNTMYSAVTVSQTSIQVKTYKVGTSATAGQLIDSFTITQPAQSQLTLSQTSWGPQSAAETLNLGVTSNVAWSAAVTSSTSWLTVANAKGSGNGTIQIKVTQNTSSKERTGTVTIGGQGVPTQTFTVTQQPPTVNWGQATWTAPMAGGSITVAVTSNTSWTISGTSSWLSVSPTSGSGNGTVTVTAAAKTSTAKRSQTLSLKASGATTKTLVVTQEASSVAVSPTSVAAPVLGGTTAAITVTANVPWTATTSATWLTINGGSGTGNGSFTVTAQAKTSTSSRSATVAIKGGGVTKNVTVTQAASTLTTSPSSSWSVTPVGGNTNVTVTSNIAWTVTTTESWLHVSLTSGVGNGSFVITADPRSTSLSRTGKVIVTGGGVTKTINVSQASTTLTVNPSSSWNAPSTAATRSETVTSNTTWTVTSNQSWLTLSTTGGTGNGSFTMIAQSHDAYGGTRPTATVTLTGSGVTRTITVTD